MGGYLCPTFEFRDNRCSLEESLSGQSICDWNPECKWSLMNFPGEVQASRLPSPHLKGRDKRSKRDGDSPPNKTSRHLLFPPKLHWRPAASPSPFTQARNYRPKQESNMWWCTEGTFTALPNTYPRSHAHLYHSSLNLKVGCSPLSLLYL